MGLLQNPYYLMAAQTLAANEPGTRGTVAIGRGILGGLQAHQRQQALQSKEEYYQMLRAKEEEEMRRKAEMDRQLKAQMAQRQAMAAQMNPVGTGMGPPTRGQNMATEMAALAMQDPSVTMPQAIKQFQATQPQIMPLGAGAVAMVQNGQIISTQYPAGKKGDKPKITPKTVELKEYYRIQAKKQENIPLTKEEYLMDQAVKAGSESVKTGFDPVTNDPYSVTRRLPPAYPLPAHLRGGTPGVPQAGVATGQPPRQPPVSAPIPQAQPPMSQPPVQAPVRQGQTTKWYQSPDGRAVMTKLTSAGLPKAQKAEILKQQIEMPSVIGEGQRLKSILENNPEVIGGFGEAKQKVSTFIREWGYKALGSETARDWSDDLYVQNKGAFTARAAVWTYEVASALANQEGRGLSDKDMARFDKALQMFEGGDDRSAKEAINAVIAMGQDKMALGEAIMAGRSPKKVQAEFETKLSNTHEWLGWDESVGAYIVRDKATGKSAAVD